MGATELTLPLSQDLIDAIRFDAREGKKYGLASSACSCCTPAVLASYARN